LQKGQNSKAGTALDKILFRIWYLCWNLTNVLRYSLIDRQKLPDCHVLALWFVARIPKLDYRFFPSIGDATTVHGVVGNRLEFRNVIPGGNQRCFIELKDELLIGSSGVQYV
jgi:hypothetical protein